MNVRLLYGLLLCSVVLSGGVGSAAVISTDNASNYPTGVVASGTNGGSGWGAWNVAIAPAKGGPIFITSSKEIGHSGLIDTSGQCWGFTAEGTNTGNGIFGTIVRPFASDGLSSGQTLSFDIDPGVFGVINKVGLSNQSGSTFIMGPNLQLNGPNDNWAINGVSGSVVNSGISPTTSIHASLTKNSNGTITTSLTPLPSGSTFTFTSTGTFGTYGLFHVEISGSFGSSSDRSQDFLLNNLVVSTPEPGMMGIIPIATLCLLARRRAKHLVHI